MAYQKGNGGHRRRRVLTEQARAEGGPQSAEGNEAREAAALSATPYAADALSDGQTLLGLVPSRLGGMLLLALSALTGVAALVALDLYRTDWGRFLRADHAVGLDLVGRGTLADWYASLLLMAASLVAVLVFSVRRHKRDDYHGRYRVWIWVALAGLVASVDATASLRLVVWDLLLALTEKDIWGLGPWAWIVPLIVVAGLLSVRFAVELWASRGAWLLAALAGGAWTTAWALGRGWLDAPGWVPHTTCVATLVLLGHALLLVSTVAYARHVILEAGGERPPRVPRKKKKREKRTRPVRAPEKAAKSSRSRSEEAADRTARTSKRVEIHAAHEGKKRGEKQQSARENRDSGSRRSESTQWVDGSEGSEGVGGDGSRRKLSKAERKRLRKQKARERRQA